MASTARAIQLAKRRRLLLESGEVDLNGYFTLTTNNSGSARGWSDSAFYGDWTPKAWLDNTLYYFYATIAGADNVALGTLDAAQLNNSVGRISVIEATVEGAADNPYVLTFTNVGGAGLYRLTDATATTLQSYFTANPTTALAVTLTPTAYA